MGKNKAKVNIPICLALILLCLTLISIHMTSGLYARYTASATATDSVKVAKFDVSGSLGKNVTVNCQQGNSGTYVLTVTNNSEVTISYSICVVFAEEVPGDKLKVTLDAAAATSENDTTKTFTNVGTLAAETVSQPLNLVFTVLDWTFVTEHAANTDSAAKTLPFTVNIIAEQVD